MDSFLTLYRWALCVFIFSRNHQLIESMAVGIPKIKRIFYIFFNKSFLHSWRWLKFPIWTSHRDTEGWGGEWKPWLLGECRSEQRRDRSCAWKNSDSWRTVWLWEELCLCTNKGKNNSLLSKYAFEITKWSSLSKILT